MLRFLTLVIACSLYIATCPAQSSGKVYSGHFLQRFDLSDVYRFLIRATTACEGKTILWILDPQTVGSK